ncbi:MAG: KdsC family phosphatase [Gemmatimonadota bacterium]
MTASRDSRGRGSGAAGRGPRTGTPSPAGRPRRPGARGATDDRGRATPELLRALRLFVFDVDGVLTDGAIYLGPGDLELKRFAVEDGTAFKLLEGLGRELAIVSGRRSAVVVKRARELGVRHVFQGVGDKERCIADLCRRRGLALERVFFQGDDLIDLPALRRVGCPVAPANAPAEVRAAALFVTPRAGGEGAVRDAVEWALRGAGLYDRAVQAYARDKRKGPRGRTPQRR